MSLLQSVQAASLGTTQLFSTAKGLFDSGEYDSSKEVLKLALQNIPLSDAKNYSICLQDMALIEYLNFNFVEAEKLYEQALQITEAESADTLDAVTILYGIGRCKRRQKKWEEAEPILDRVISLRSKLLGDEHRLVSNSSLDLAINFDRQGKFAQAEPYYLKTLAIREKLWGKQSLGLTAVLEDYSKMLRKMGNNAPAAELESRISQLRINGHEQAARPLEGESSGWLHLCP